MTLVPVRGMPRARRPVALLAAACIAGCSPDPYPGERGAVLHLATQKVKTLDPANASDVPSARAVDLLYEGLYAYEPFRRPYALEPAIAAGPPEVSRDGHVYLFRLRQGVRFCDDACFPRGRGREVTAEDFVYAWKRIAHAGVNSQGWWILEGKVRGLDAFRAGTHGLDPREGYDREVSGLRAPDARTLRVELVRPDPQFPWLLAMPYTVAVPREAVERYGEAFARHPVGSGAFVLEDLVWGWRIKFRRNPDYRGAPRLPRADGVVLLSFGESQPAWLYFLAGYLDRIAPPAERFEEAIEADALAPALRERGIVLEKVPELQVRYIALNTVDPVLANPDVRRALCLAADTDWAIAHLYNGRGIRAHGPIPPGLPEYDPDYRHPYAGPDRARARAMLARAGYPGGRGPDGRPLRLTMEIGGASPRARRVYEAFAADLRAIGIELRASINTWPLFIQKIRTRRAQLWEITWVADYPDAQNFLAILYGPNAGPGPNGANYANPAYDVLYERFRAMRPGPERTALARRMVQVANADCPWIPRFFPVAYVLRHGWLENHKYADIHGQNVKVFAIDRAARDRRTRSWNRPRYGPLAALAAALGALGAIAWVRRRR